MKVLLLSLLFIITSACEAPRTAKKRLEDETEGFAVECDRNVYNCDSVVNNNGNNNNDNDDDNNDNDTDTPSVNVPSGATACAWSNDGSTNFSSRADLIGDYTICKSSIDSKIAYFQLKTPIASGTKLCFIPLGKVTPSSSDTTYLGNPHCDYFPKNDSIYELKFNITRVPVGQSANTVEIAGFMILRDDQTFYSAPFPYYRDQYSRLIPQNGGSLKHYQAYYSCIDALEIYRTSSYCSEYERTGQFINHYPF